MESVVGDTSNTALDTAWSSALGQVNAEGSDIATTSHSYSPSNVQSVSVNAPPSVNMSHVFPCSSVVDSSSPAPATPLSQRSDEFSNSHILEPGEIIPHVCVFSQVSSTLDSPHPLPPKKPLTPYMQFSKSVSALEVHFQIRGGWQTVLSFFFNCICMFYFSISH